MKTYRQSTGRCRRPQRPRPADRNDCGAPTRFPASTSRKSHPHALQAAAADKPAGPPPTTRTFVLSLPGMVSRVANQRALYLSVRWLRCATSSLRKTANSTLLNEQRGRS